MSPAGEAFSGEHATTTPTLIDRLLAEQRDLSAVERFSARHERHDRNGHGGAPAMEGRYQALLPAAPPSEGEQYAFAVDLDACSGCKGCVSACHSLNGLDKAEEETWRSVGLLHGSHESPEAPGSHGSFQQTITTACHHCVEPGCLEGCPVLAYEKDARTGIVRHLDDQCIGCQYCILKCPYDVPQYSPSRGIVRKCDLCSNRLAVGEAPACVQACPNGAIMIAVVRKEDALAAARRGEFLPGTPDPAITAPTTRYLSRRTPPADLRPADVHRLRPDHGHPALVGMLVLTQASVGLYAADLVLRRFAPGFAGEVRQPILFLAAALGLAGIATSLLHLGRPLGAWRALLGLRTSWLSREIAAFGLFAGIVVVRTALLLLEPLSQGRLPSALVDPIFHFIASVWGEAAALQAIDVTGGTVARLSGNALLTRITVLVGLAAVGTSVMIYADTRRAAWSAWRTAFRFYGTVLLLGAAAVLPVLARCGSPNRLLDAALVLLALLTVAKVGGEAILFLHPAVAAAEAGEIPAWTWSPRRKTALLLLGPLGGLLRLRNGAGLLGGLLLPFLLLMLGHVHHRIDLALCALVTGLVFLGEAVERHLFFVSAAPPKMPGHFEKN